MTTPLPGLPAMPPPPPTPPPTTLSSADVLVELEALNTYYAELWKVYDHLGAAVLRADGIGEVAEDDVPYGHRIQGVEHALHSARTSMHGTRGQHHTLAILHRIVTSHLQAVYDTYQSYVTTDVNQSTTIGLAPQPLTAPPPPG